MKNNSTPEAPLYIDLLTADKPKAPELPIDFSGLPFYCNVCPRRSAVEDLIRDQEPFAVTAEVKTGTNSKGKLWRVQGVNLWDDTYFIAVLPECCNPRSTKPAKQNVRR
jgi:hypothetical protein